jgi:hypothetical protein
LYVFFEVIRTLIVKLTQEIKLYYAHSRVTVGVRGQRGGVVDSQNGSAVGLNEGQILRYGLIFRLEIDAAMGGVRIGEEIPITKKAQINSDVRLSGSRCALQKRLSGIHILQYERLCIVPHVKSTSMICVTRS